MYYKNEYLVLYLYILYLYIMMMKEQKIWMKIALLTGLVILTWVNIYNYTTTNVAKEFEVMQVGGVENYEKLQKAYTTENYKEAQKKGLENAKEQYASPDMEKQIEAMKKAKEEKAKAEKLRLKPGQGVLDELAQIKEHQKLVNGPKDARFTILEYSELLCPYCKRHSTDETLKKVREMFPVEVNVIHIPYLVHPQAKNIEEGLMCARDQKDVKTYYAFLEALFRAPTSFDTVDENMEILLAEAKKIGYDVDVLKKCFEDGKYADELIQQGNNARVKFWVESTPNNIIIDTQNGDFYNIQGAYPVSEFEARIKAMKGKTK